MNTQNETRLGTEPLFRLMVRMALPSMAAQIVTLLYSVTARIYVGHIAEVGTQALAGVGLTNAVITIIAAAAMIVGSGGAPRASIELGRGEREQAEYYLGNGFVLLGILTAILMICAYAFMGLYLPAVGASEVTLPYAQAYLRIYLLGTPFVMVTMGLNSFISLQGRPGISMLSVVLGAVINIALDPVLIFACGMGVRGAALATVISQACSAAWILRFLLGPKASLRLRRDRMSVRGSVIGRTCTLGAAPFFMGSTEGLIGFVLNACLAVHGDIYVSALTVMQSMMMLVSAPLQGFAQGVSPVLSYNYGRGDTGRVKRAFGIQLAVMFLFNFIVVGTVILLPSAAARLYTADEQLIAVITQYMPLFLSGFLIFGLQRACQNTFVATGQALVSMFIALLRKIILLIPLVIVLGRVLGVRGVYMGEAIADGTAALLCTAIFCVKFPRILRSAQHT